MVDISSNYSFFYVNIRILDSMDIRHKLQDSIESHGGKIIEKLPNAV
jgi:hypothetical protein